jgi:O-antigen/teichoic acid export membrane protein
MRRLTGRLSGSGSAGSGSGGGGLRGGRQVVAGLSDQVLVALTSAGTSLLATAVLDRPAAGAMLFSLAFMYFAQGVSRAFVGDTMLAHVSRYDGDGDRRRQFTNAHATAGTLGVLGAVVLLAIWALSGYGGLRDLIWGVPFVPSVLMQDAARYTYQTQRHQHRALIIDVCWVLVQAVTVSLLVVTHHVSGGALIASWGLGATVGVLVFYARTRINPFRGRPLAWLRDTRHLLGWFTAIGILGQVTVLSTGTLVTGILTRAAYSGLRVVQTLVLQPAQSFVMALNGLIVPRASRLARDADGAGLRRLIRNLVLITGGLGVLGLAVVLLAAHPVLNVYKGGSYRDIATISLPIGLQAVIYLLQVPFTMALRGMHRARMLFLQYAIFSVTQLTGLVIGALHGQLLGAVWGLMIGSSVGLVVQVLLYLVAVRRLAAPSGGSDEPDSEAVEEQVL